MIILAIDPGTEKSAWLIYNTEAKKPLQWYIESNNEIIEYLRKARVDIDLLVIEMFACQGMPVGKATFEACAWIGRFEEAFGIKHSRRVFRSEEKMHLCGSMRAKDPNIRQALMDRYGSSRRNAVGLKKSPGPLYGFHDDLWSALAVAVTWSETKGGE